ncbi:MAG: Rieske 2Fe-2S domain-containing protein [Ginsengibacter sp.]
MTDEKKYKWYKVAESVLELDFERNNLVQIEAGGKKICIAKIGDSLFACNSKCPHAGGNMSEGKLDKNHNIVCPVHGYCFSLKHGREVNGEGYFLKIYPTRITEDGVFVGFEEGSFFDWLK